MAETGNGLYKAELVRNFGPWRDAAHLEAGRPSWAAWWGTRRLCSYCGWVPPAEAEAAFWAAGARLRRTNNARRQAHPGTEAEILYVTAGGEDELAGLTCPICGSLVPVLERPRRDCHLDRPAFAGRQLGAGEAGQPP